MEIGGNGTRYQGLKFHTLVNMKTNEISRNLVVLKSGKHSKKGLVFNFCPFCRNELVKNAVADLATKAAATQAIDPMKTENRDALKAGKAAIQHE